MSASIYISRTGSYSNLLAQRFNLFKNEAEMTDFQICIGDDVIDCHRVILAAFSPVLHRMIVSRMREQVSQQVQLESIAVDIMKLLLDYMYSGELRIRSGEELMSVIQACDYLQILELREVCVQQAPELVSADNAIEWMQFAELYRLEVIQRRCTEVICASFKEISEGEDFPSLSEEVLSDWLSEAGEKGADNDDLLMAIFRWINHDMESRVERLEDLLRNVKHEECSAHTIQKIMIEYSQILDANPVFYKMHVKQLVQKQLASADARGNASSEQRLIVLGGKDPAENQVCWELRNEAGFQEALSLPECVSEYHSVCVHQGTDIVVTGGWQSATLCIMYVAADKEWKELPNLRQERQRHASVCVDGTLYVIGGDVSEEWSQSVEELSLKEQDGREEEAEEDEEEEEEEEEGTWQEITALPIRLFHPKVAQLGSNVFVMGDSHRELLHADTRMLQSWNRQAPIPTNPGDGYSMAAVNDMVFVAGGDRDICYWYCVKSDCWVKANPPPLKSWFGALCCHGDCEKDHPQKLLLLGGGNDALQQYDIEQDTWTVSATKLPKSLYHLHAFLIQM